MNTVIKMNYDFRKTRAALAKYDAYSEWMDKTEYWHRDNESTLRTFARLDQFARKVGRAYGEDTSLVNSPDMTESCVRPSPWLRKMVEVKP